MLDNTYFAGDMLATIPDAIVRAGWARASNEPLVVLVLTPTAAEKLGERVITSITAGMVDDDRRWIRAAIDMLSAANHADLQVPATAQPAREPDAGAPSPSPSVVKVVDGMVEVQTMAQFAAGEPGTRMTPEEFTAAGGSRS